jgi:hypothetical protein
MRVLVTLACIFLFSAAHAEKKIRIGSLPLKNGAVVLVQEYLSKTKMPQKVMVVSPHEEVYAFASGVVTKVLEIDDKVSVFVRKGPHYFVYNNLYAVAVNEGDRLDKGDLIAGLRYNRKYGEYQMEMQIWHDNGTKTRRLPNSQVVDILQGAKPSAPRVEKAKKSTRHIARKGKSGRKAYSHSRKHSKKAARHVSKNSKKIKAAKAAKAAKSKKALARKKKKK